MGFPKKLAQAKTAAVYWDNYVNYLATLDDKQPNIGNGTPKPPQILLYIKPFALDLHTDQFLSAYGTNTTWSTQTAKFTGYTTAALTGDQIALKLKNVRPARVVIKTGMTTNSVVKTSKATKRKYLSRGGTAGSVPFGKNGSTEEANAFAAIKTAIGVAAGQSVSRVREKV